MDRVIFVLLDSNTPAFTESGRYHILDVES